jgi:hypothetical protein
MFETGASSAHAVFQGRALEGMEVGGGQDRTDTAACKMESVRGMPRYRNRDPVWDSVSPREVPCLCTSPFTPIDGEILGDALPSVLRSGAVRRCKDSRLVPSKSQYHFEPIVPSAVKPTEPTRLVYVLDFLAPRSVSLGFELLASYGHCTIFSMV